MCVKQKHTDFPPKSNVCQTKTHRLPTEVEGMPINVCQTKTHRLLTEVEGMPINVCQTKTHRLPTEVEGSNQSHVQ